MKIVHSILAIVCLGLVLVYGIKGNTNLEIASGILAIWNQIEANER